MGKTRVRGGPKSRENSWRHLWIAPEGKERDRSTEGRKEGRERDLLGIKWMSALPGTGRRDTYLSLSSSARTSRSLGIVFRSIQKGSNPVGNEQVFPFQMRDVNQTERMHFVRKVSSLRRRSRRRRQIVFAFPTTSPETRAKVISNGRDERTSSGLTLWWISWMPTSLVRTSLHTVPRSFIRASANSRRLPCSTPELDGIN